MVCLTILYIVGALFLSLYLYYKWTQTYWKRKGLYTLEGKKVRDSTAGYFELKEKGLKHGGSYRFGRAVYIPIDLDIIKSILIKNFDHFVNRGFYFNEKDDPLSMSLVNVEDEKWKSMRMKLSPTFTSGKMKMMFPTMEQCATKFIKLLERHAENKTPAEIKQTASRLTIDVIGTVAFGIDCKAIEDENSEFQELSKEFSTMTWRRLLSFTFDRRLLTMIKFKSRTKQLEKFFIDLVDRMIQYRDTNEVTRKDFLQLLLELRDKGEISEDDNFKNATAKRPESAQKYMSLTEITAQCVTFFGAGFETSSTAISFTLMELAFNQDVQEKLRTEVREYLKEHGQFSYEGVMNTMTYLDKVVDESLRRHSPAGGTQRICKKAFPVPGTDFTLEAGTLVLLPFFGIHMDPDIYPNPQKFDPERFSPENKAKRNPMTFTPFGEGPRICIGFRFAYLEIKLAVAMVINKFKVTINDKTIQPIEYDPRALTRGVKGGIWLNFTKI